MMNLYTRNCGNFLYRRKATQCLERTQREGVLFLNITMLLKVFSAAQNLVGIIQNLVGIIQQVVAERICWFPVHLSFHTRRKLLPNIFFGHFDRLSGIFS